MARKTFPGIDKAAFVSDADRRALEALTRVPLLPLVVQKFYEHGLDRWMYLYNMARAVRCGPRQFATLHSVLRESCAILDMPEPELYVTSNPFPNAFVGGVERPYITLRSSMVESLDDEQLYYLMGHELGHVKAGHVLYMSVAQLLLPLLDMLGRRTFGLGDAATIALTLAMYEWYRQAEISADRAGLIVSQDLGDCLDSILALTAGPNRLLNESDRDAFMEQARAYQDASVADSLGKLLWFFLVNGTATHPMPVHRAQMIERWAQSGDYDRIRAGDYPKAVIGAGV